MPSVNTNMGAAVALKNLNFTTRDLEVTQNRISTGYKVVGAKDDASSFAIAEGIRASIKAVSAVQQSLAGARGIGDVALAGATQLSNLLQDMKKKILEGMNAGNTAQQQTILAADFTKMITQYNNFIANSSYNGKNLLSAASTSATVISTITGGTLTINTQSALAVLAITSAALTSTTTSTSALTDVDAAITAVGTALGALGGDVRALQFQQDFLQQVNDANTEGLGNLVDADLAAESAKLQSLQVKQQLGVQALSIANQSPQILLSLFR